MHCYSIVLRLLLLTVALCGCASNATHHDAALAASSEVTGLAALLPGTWELKNRIVGDKEMPVQTGVFLIVTKDSMMQVHVLKGPTWQSGSSMVQNVFFRLDQSSDPVAIDTTGMADWTKLRKGICRLENDVLTLCDARADDPRPTEFATGDVPGQGNVLNVYKRVSDRR
ncbi:MAG: hypothetical protein JWP89_3390 [Schlesneria sp.]|nr:hypothetical protein [Schlesneria sp.]